MATCYFTNDTPDVGKTNNQVRNRAAFSSEQSDYLVSEQQIDAADDKKQAHLSSAPSSKV